MSALKLKLEPDGLGRALDQPNETNEPSHAQTYDIFQIFNEYLQPDTKTSHDSAVKSLLALVPKVDNDPEVMTIINVVLEFAEQIPYYHPSHIKLARIMEQFTCHGRFTWKLPDDIGLQLLLGSFPVADRAIIGVYNRRVLHTDSGGSLQRWKQVHLKKILNPGSNLNAFLAHAQARRVGANEPYDADKILCNTFERFCDTVNFKGFSKFEGERDQQIIAAAQYILWDGQTLFKRCLCPDLAEMGDRRVRDSGDTRLVFGLGRWRGWKNGFKKNAEEENGMGEECRKVCAKTAALMEAIEASMRF